MNVVLISTYDLGHQPFGLASPAAGLRAEDHVVTSLDLSVAMLDAAVVRAAVFIQVWERLQAAFDGPARRLPEIAPGIGAVPRFSEPWYCCAEPTPRPGHAF